MGWFHGTPSGIEYYDKGDDQSYCGPVTISFLN
jgi:hypothetical protein